MKYKVLLLSLIVILLSGCGLFFTEQPYEFRQEYDQIVDIKIVECQNGKFDLSTARVVKTLDITEHRSFVDDLKKIKGGRVGMDPSTGFGPYIICISYQDGEVELIGNYNNGYVSADGRIHNDCYAMNKEQFYALLSKVLGEQITEPTGISQT